MVVEAFRLRDPEIAGGLAILADRAGFDRHHDLAAVALADRYTFRLHIDIAARQRAWGQWIASLQDGATTAMDHRRFIRACADLIAAHALNPSIRFSVMIREASDPMSEVVAAWPNEVTALAAGASLYSARVGALTGTDPGEPLAPAVVENAAALLRRHPEDAAIRFRELLRLTTPWT